MSKFYKIIWQTQVIESSNFFGVGTYVSSAILWGKSDKKPHDHHHHEFYIVFFIVEKTVCLACLLSKKYNRDIIITKNQRGKKCKQKVLFPCMFIAIKKKREKKRGKTDGTLLIFLPPDETSTNF